MSTSNQGDQSYEQIIGQWLPCFPLSLVAYPGQPLNLHIFEPRYRELVADLGVGGYFGIPPYIDNELAKTGTLMRILDITDQQPDGKCNIKLLGVTTFELEEWVNPLDGKLYAACTYKLNQDDSVGSPVLINALLGLRSSFFKWIAMTPPELTVLPGDYVSFAVAGKLGLSLTQEAYLLSLTTENQRLSYLINHLERVNNVLAETERTRVLVKSNGHFKNLDPLTF